MTTFTLDGTAVRDIPSLYAELDRVLMPDEEWTLGASLDALDDLLYGGFGELATATEPVQVVWTDAAASRRALGRAATIAYYREKVARPDVFDARRFTPLLAEAEAGRGPIYFDLVLDVFAAHPEIDLRLA
ncbi:barstar family protein [Microbacterium sp. CJ88]|uniref:barstar family protein n=1 Tax=Microbacterium sp. CJ88 TaxID=3445672 RepID=UPI003F65A8A3